MKNELYMIGRQIGQTGFMLTALYKDLMGSMKIT
jgi:hypothetical protein